MFAGLMLALALASLDQNIVGVALPQIVSELGGLHHLSWVVTSFLVTSTATTPLYGKLSDMYGRKPLFIIAIVIFLIGSCLCGLSRSMTELVVFRGIQGMGAGGLMVLAQTTIADLVAPRERGRYQGLFGAVFAFSSIAGPLLGGFITSALSWRWIFYVNVPVGIPALAMIAFGFHRPHHKVPHRIDYTAVALLTSATVALLLVLSWGGVQFPWSSPLIIGLAMASMVLTVLLIRTERRSLEPVLSPHIFHNRTVVIASSVMGLAFMGIFGAFVFLPLFFQLVMGMEPAKAGLMLAPMTGGLIATSFIGGRLVSRTGRYKIYPVVGLGCASLSFIVVMWAAASNSGIGVIEAALIVPRMRLRSGHAQSCRRPAECGWGPRAGRGNGDSGVLQTARRHLRRGHVRCHHDGPAPGSAYGTLDRPGERRPHAHGTGDPGYRRSPRCPARDRDQGLPPCHKHHVPRRRRHHDPGLCARAFSPGASIEIRTYRQFRHAGGISALGFDSTISGALYRIIGCFCCYSLFLQIHDGMMHSIPSADDSSKHTSKSYMQRLYT